MLKPKPKGLEIRRTVLKTHTTKNLPNKTKVWFKSRHQRFSSKEEEPLNLWANSFSHNCDTYLIRKTTSFSFLCVILRDLPQQNPRALCRGSSLNFICSHGNISFLRNRKQVRKSTESCLCKGRFSYFCVLLRFGNTLRLTPSTAPPSGRECTHTRTSPTSRLDTQAPHLYWPCLPRQGYCV